MIAKCLHYEYLKKMKNLIFIILFFNAFSLYAQTYNCLNDFEILVNKIENDYPGYNDKVTNKNRDELFTLEKNIRERIALSPDSCKYFLQEYTNFFKDNHLKVKTTYSQYYQNRKEMSCSSYGKNVDINIDSLQNISKNEQGIEGIWKGYSDEFAIIKRGDNHYLGIAINMRTWNKNHVVYEFIQDSSNSFRLIEHSLFEGVKPRENRASLMLNGKLLELHDISRFVRKTDSPAFDYAFVSSYIPEYPNGLNTYWVALALTDSTFYLRLPSFYDKEVENLVKKHWNEITSRPNLVIDIRNNGGGLDQYYTILLDLIYTKPYQSKGVEWLASEGNIEVFEDALKTGDIRNGDEGIKWTKTLLNEMKSHKDEFVVHPLMGKDVEIKKDTIYKFPKKVGIIINEHNASSAEQFILSAKNSDKVILFGNENTAGVLDYSNAIEFNFPSGKHTLIYPMTRSRRLPENPIDNIGIAPDVFIPLNKTTQLFDRLDEWVYFVKNYLEYKQN